MNVLDPAYFIQAESHIGFAVVAPLCGVGAFLFDGVFIGATASAEMRNVMVVCLVVCVSALEGLTRLPASLAFQRVPSQPVLRLSICRVVTCVANDACLRRVSAAMVSGIPM